MPLIKYNPIPELRACVRTEPGRLSFTVPFDMEGQRVDSFLRKCGVSSKTMRSAKHDPLGLTQNGEHVRTIDPVIGGAVISITTGDAQQSYLKASGINIPVLFEDEHIIAFDKPPGINTHPSNRDATDSLLNYVHEHFENRTFRPLTRLDKNTSGVLLVAKTAFAATAIKTLPEKQYLAIAQGEADGAGLIDLPITRSKEHVMRRRVLPEGSPSITGYHPLSVKNGHSLFLVRPLTGRTHQIRVHMEAIGHVLAGDDLYGGSDSYINRHSLHCARLTFTHPFTGEPVKIEAPLPDDFKDACAALFGHVPSLCF